MYNALRGYMICYLLTDFIQMKEEEKMSVESFVHMKQGYIFSINKQLTVELLKNWNK